MAGLRHVWTGVVHQFGSVGRASFSPIKSASRMTRPRPRTLILGVAIAAILALVLVWNWDWFIPFVERTASAALARPVTVQHLHVHIARNPVLQADGVVIGNPPSFPEGSKLAEIDKLALTV